MENKCLPNLEISFLSCTKIPGKLGLIILSLKICFAKEMYEFNVIDW